MLVEHEPLTDAHTDDGIKRGLAVELHLAASTELASARPWHIDPIASAIVAQRLGERLAVLLGANGIGSFHDG
jgi:hypothetical protein